MLTLIGKLIKREVILLQQKQIMMSLKFLEWNVKNSQKYPRTMYALAVLVYDKDLRFFMKFVTVWFTFHLLWSMS